MYIYIILIRCMYCLIFWISGDQSEFNHDRLLHARDEWLWFTQTNQGQNKVLIPHLNINSLSSLLNLYVHTRKRCPTSSSPNSLEFIMIFNINLQNAEHQVLLIWVLCFCHYLICKIYEQQSILYSHLK